MTKKTNPNLFLAIAVHLLVLLICISSTFATGTYDDGDGSAGNPFQINTPVQMDEIGQHSEDWASYFILTADINLSDYTGTAFHIIGTSLGNSFVGTFDGNGHIVSNFTYTSTGASNIALFGCVGNGGEIKNLGMVDVNVDAGMVFASGAGGLVGLLGGSISYCFVDGGSISGYRDVGGLVGKHQGTVSNCYTTSDVSGGSAVGGLVGYNNQRTISDCYAIGSISGGQSIGGLVGYNFLGVVSSCYSYGTVSGSSYVGGLIGGGNGTVYLSYWDTETSGQSISAGGNGKTTAEMMLLQTYRGWGFGTPWTLDEGDDYPRLVWESAGGILITDEVRNYGGGNGEPGNPYQIFTPEQFATIGWYRQDFDKHFILMDDIDLSVCDPNDWAIIGNKNIPFTGTFDGDNRTISNFTYNNNSSHIGLIGYIDSGGAIRNLGLANPNIDAGFGWYVGGVVGGLYDGEISNCSVEGGSISGHRAVGGLAGRQHDGTISNSYATVDVSGDFWIGGLVGQNGATITNCYTTGSVSGIEDVGGLVGESVGDTISNCCAIGSVSGGENVGGLVGESWASGTITNCYATGIVTGTSNTGGLVGYTWAGSTVTASFWDIDTSGQATSAGGTGKTTAEMQMRSTFTDSGWDFCSETANGIEDIWVMFVDGLDYPKLTYFTGDTDGDCVPDDSDNCPFTYNPGQEDDDSDGLGNVCDPCPNDPDDDADSDGICGDIDNCPNTANPVQTDSDGDGIGDECECFAANLDGINPVNLGDFAIVASDWLLTGPGLEGDTNRDESVDVIDIEQVAQWWLSDCDPP